MTQGNYDRNIGNIPLDIRYGLLWRAGAEEAAGRRRGCGGVASSTDEAAVKDVTDPRGCGEDERWKLEEKLEGECGDMEDDEVPTITEPAEFHRKLIRGEWTSCATDDVFPFNFGIACGNWGGNYKNDQAKQEHMFWDIYQHPGHCICAQEMEADFCQELSNPTDITSAKLVRNWGNTERKEAKNAQDRRWFVVRGVEKGKSTAVAVRNWPFKGIRRDCFILADAGQNRGGEQYYNRTLFATLKFNKRYWQTGEKDDDTIGVCSAHLHYGCASGANERGANCREDFWDRLAIGILEFKTRFLCIDANVALPSVAIELRARGLCITLVAFSPFRDMDKKMVKLDSLGIFVIGGTRAIKPAYSPTVVGVPEPVWGEKDKYTKKTIKQVDGNQDIAVDWPVPILRHLCPGYPMTSYRPQDPALREKYLTNSFTPLRIWEEDAMQSVLLEKRTSNHKFGGREWVDEFGRETFDWPPLHTLRHKPLQAKIVDNNSDRFFLGANGHMPLLVFICDPAGEQRSNFRIRERKFKKRPRRGGARKSKETKRHGAANRISEFFCWRVEGKGQIRGSGGQSQIPMLPL